MGNIFTRAAQLPKAVLLFVLLAFTSVLALSLHTGTASADGIVGASPYGGKAVFIVKLTGSANPSQYTVTASRQSNNETLNLTYIAGGVKSGDGPEFFTKDGFVWGGDNSQCINSSGNPSNTALGFSWKFTVTAGGKSAGSKSVNYCGQANGTGNMILVSIGVKDGQTTGSGTASGTLAYVAPDGTSQPFRSATVASLTGGSGSTAIKVSDNGTFTVSSVPAGTYTLKATYNPTNFDHGELQNGPPYVITTNVTITDGKNTDASFTVGANGQVTAGTTIATAACADGQSKDGTGACTDNGEDTINCGSGSFNWVVCPFIQAAVKGAQQLDNFIMNTLDFDLEGTFDHTDVKNSAANGYYTAWNSFRILGTAFLVIAGLVMVASQALGFEFLDAYTIRKTLPRLLVAIVGISLSWPLMRFVVGFFDVAGFDIRQLIYTPFKNFGGSVSVSGGILSTIAVGAALWVMGFASLTLILTVIMAVFVGFLILLLRQIALIMLIIVAPVAIACYILPNTQRAWNLWRDNFLGLLLMFPIISGLIAAAHVFSAVALKNADAASLAAHASGPVSQLTGHGFTQMTRVVANFVGSWTSQAVAIGAWFYVYFLIPTAANMAIGTVTTLIGRVNNPAKGAFNRLSKARGDAARGKLKKAQGNQLLPQTNKFNRGINSAASMLTDPGGNLPYYLRNKPGFRRAGAKTAGQLEHARVSQSKKLLEEINPGSNDKSWRALNGALHGSLWDTVADTYDEDDVNGAYKKGDVKRDAKGNVMTKQVKNKDGLSWDTKQKLSNAGLLGRSPTTIGQLNKMEEILAGSAEQTERAAAINIEANKGRLATLYQDPDMGKASIQAASIMGLAQHGFMNRNDLAPAVNRLQDEGGKAYAQTIGTQAQLMASRSRPDMGPGYGLDYDEHTKQFTDGLQTNGGLRAYEAIARLNPSDFGGAKSGLYKSEAEGGSGDVMVEILKNGKTQAAKDAAEALKGKSADEKKVIYQQWEAQKPGSSIEKRKLEAAYNNYESLRKVLLQNASQFAHGSIDTQTQARRILVKGEENPDAAVPRNAAEAAEAARQQEAADAAAANQPPTGGATN